MMQTIDIYYGLDISNFSDEHLIEIIQKVNMGINKKYLVFNKYTIHTNKRFFIGKTEKINKKDKTLINTIANQLDIPEATFHIWSFSV